MKFLYLNKIRFLFIYSLVQVLVILLTIGHGVFPDSQGYVEAIIELHDSDLSLNERTKFLFGSRPLALLIPYLLSFVFSPISSYVIQSSLCILLSSSFIFKLSNSILKDSQLSFYSSLIFISSFPILYWGNAILTEMPSYLIFIITTYLVINLFEKWPNNTSIIFVAIICGIGFLIKQMIMFSFIYFYLLLFSNKINSLKLDYKDILFKCILFFTFYLLPILLTEVIIYLFFDDLLIFNFINDYLISSHQLKEYFHKSPMYFIQTFFIAFGLLVPFFIIGCSSFLRIKHQIVIFSFFFISTLVPIITHIYYSPRFTFYLFPFIIPIATLGLSRFSLFISTKFKSLKFESIMILLIIMYVISNNFILIFSNFIRELLGFWPKIL